MFGKKKSSAAAEFDLFGTLIKLGSFEKELQNFVDKVQKIAPQRYPVDDLLKTAALVKVKRDERFYFIEDLENSLISEKRQSKLPAANERLLARNEAAEPEVDDSTELDEVPSEPVVDLPDSSEQTVSIYAEDPDDGYDDVPLLEVIDEKPDGGLIHSPKERKKRSFDNLKVVLDWLRLEPYSTSEVMALVLRVTIPGARKILNKAVRDGWLIRDEVDWIGSSRKVHLFGISSRGLFHLMDDDGVEPAAYRDFKRGRTKPSSASHVLNIQLARLYWERRSNGMNGQVVYRAARDLPNYMAKGYRWPTYPDAVMSDTHLIYSSNPNRGLSVAIEIEQMGKGSKRYRELIKAHEQNIDGKDYKEDLYSERYDHVVYYLPTRQEARNLERLFHKIIDGKGFGDESDKETTRNCFVFDTYEDLAERVRELG